MEDRILLVVLHNDGTCVIACVQTCLNYALGFFLAGGTGTLYLITRIHIDNFVLDCVDGIKWQP